jgi:peroxiredoxin
MLKFLTLLVVLAVAGATYWFVSKDKIESYYEEPAGAAMPAAQPAGEKYPLLIGKVFPDAELLDVNNVKMRSVELVRSGAVVLFLETSCSNCEAMIEKWKNLVAAETITPDEIFGICFQKPAEASAYHHQHVMNFPIYCDTAGYYLVQHEVHDFPLQLVVGRSGMIHESTYDARRQVFPDQLHRWLSE